MRSQLSIMTRAPARRVDLPGPPRRTPGDPEPRLAMQSNPAEVNRPAVAGGLEPGLARPGPDGPGRARPGAGRATRRIPGRGRGEPPRHSGRKRRAEARPRIEPSGIGQR